MKNKKIIIFIIFILIISLCYIKNILFSQNSYENFSYDNTVIIENTEKENVKDEFIKIHIYGEVVKQGILELPVDSRVYDAIELSGGTTENADISKINLAYILSDGEKVYIPSINDNEDTLQTETTNFYNQKVNINTATIEQLEKLNGIGETIAKAIVEYRDNNGKFNNIEDIKNVSGIGENKFQKIKDSISVK